MKTSLRAEFLYINFLIHPLPLAAVALTFVNDHWLKYRFPGLLTGKISDFTGLFYFPILFCALVILAKRSLGFCPPKLTHAIILSALVITAVGFTLLKTSFIARAVYIYFYEIMGVRAQVTADSGDLIALGSLLPSYIFLKKYLTHP